eukprot:scaffold1048_cov224-Pinguiococcus_pyrenoidosus.AAC.2
MKLHNSFGVEKVHDWRLGFWLGILAVPRLEKRISSLSHAKIPGLPGLYRPCQSLSGITGGGMRFACILSLKTPLNHPARLPRPQRRPDAIYSSPRCTCK